MRSSVAGGFHSAPRPPSGNIVTAAVVAAATAAAAVVIVTAVVRLRIGGCKLGGRGGGVWTCSSGHRGVGIVAANTAQRHASKGPNRGGRPSGRVFMRCRENRRGGAALLLLLLLLKLLLK